MSHVGVRLNERKFVFTCIKLHEFIGNPKPCWGPGVGAADGADDQEVVWV